MPFNVPRDSHGKPMVIEDCVLGVIQGYIGAFEKLGKLQQHVTRYRLRFPCDKKSVIWIGITVFVLDRVGQEVHLTKWWPYSATKTDFHPTKEEIVAKLFEPLEEICKARQI